MKPDLAQHLRKVGATVSEVDRVLSSHKYPDDRRTVMVMGLLSTITEHHHSMLQLIKSGATASSYALARDIVKGMRYGLWINRPATEEQIRRIEESIEESDEFPFSIPEMTKEIEAAYSTDPFFVNLKNRWAPQLYKYTRSDIFQVGRWDVHSSPGLDVDDEVIRDVTTAATICIVLLAAKFLAGHGHSTDCKQIEALAADYANRGKASSA
jgi:hypothetical protein